MSQFNRNFKLYYLCNASYNYISHVHSKIILCFKVSKAHTQVAGANNHHDATK